MNKYIEAYSDDIYDLHKLYDLLSYCLKLELYPFSDPEDHNVLFNGLEAIKSIISAWNGNYYEK